ncbi:hypothetical protein R3P38DRAFT_2791344 [Favolaschia claudopus]|uniref:Uncharacterized protein n=1 Tax=Favolaschia claudopus TaxID=2862362 RepID=A0AAW0AH74_9AGAR
MVVLLRLLLLLLPPPAPTSNSLLRAHNTDARLPRPPHPTTPLLLLLPHTSHTVHWVDEILPDRREKSRLGPDSELKKEKEARRGRGQYLVCNNPDIGGGPGEGAGRWKKSTVGAEKPVKKAAYSCLLWAGESVDTDADSPATYSRWRQRRRGVLCGIVVLAQEPIEIRAGAATKVVGYLADGREDSEHAREDGGIEVVIWVQAIILSHSIAEVLVRRD